MAEHKHDHAVIAITCPDSVFSLFNSLVDAAQGTDYIVGLTNRGIIMLGHASNRFPGRVILIHPHKMHDVGTAHTTSTDWFFDRDESSKALMDAVEAELFPTLRANVEALVEIPNDASALLEGNEP